MLNRGRPVGKIHCEVKVRLLEVFKKHKSKVGERDIASTGKYQFPICSLQKKTC